MVAGNITLYLIACTIRYPHKELMRYLKCPAKSWKMIHYKTSLRMNRKYKILLSAFIVISGLGCYFHMIFEQAVGIQNLAYWGIIFGYACALDLIIFGILPSNNQQYKLLNIIRCRMCYS